MRVLLFLLYFVLASGQPCDDNFSIDVSNGDTFRDGSVIHKGIRYPPSYVFKKNVSGEFKTYGCLCELRKCVRKCCEVGSAYNLRKKICTNNETDDLIENYGFNISFREDFVKNVALVVSGFGLVYGKPNCAGYIEERDLWHLQEVSLLDRSFNLLKIGAHVTGCKTVLVLRLASQLALHFV